MRLLDITGTPGRQSFARRLTQTRHLTYRKNVRVPFAVPDDSTQNRPRFHIFRIFRAKFAFCFLISVTYIISRAFAATDLPFERDPGAAFSFEGFTAARINACVTNWLLTTPSANPGMLEMFQLRDRQPAPNLVPWAGEFVGKYLISAIQIERLGHPELHSTISDIVSQLIASQASDGYLGPFPKSDRLLKHWDLWGHYHCMLALLLWHEQTNDPKSLESGRRAADLVCDTYLDTNRRMFDAGSDEMNLSIIHALGWLYRLTSSERYLRMIREIEKDWERGGDFLRAGLAGTEFFQTRRPRWESLHSLQGLVELYRITGEEKYRIAFEHHWRSIARWDIRNTGGFSSGEQATGNPYAATPIETCCSIAWMALSIDMLQLTGDSTIADALELATFNAWAGAQHPSGRWCTYNTPMDGAREASAHTIVFQSRPGTPELNCCSVNGPRGWGMLADWALMRTSDGLALNWLAPATLKGSSGIALKISGDYPIDSRISIAVTAPGKEDFTLRIRIPAWSSNPVVRIDGQPGPAAITGTYLVLRRNWKSESIDLSFDMPIRVQPGAKDAIGKVSLYRGPLLLAWDQRFNDCDENQIPRLDPKTVSHFETHPIDRTTTFPPLQLLSVTSANGQPIRLCDFASAGALGTRYVSWLPATNTPPGPVVTRMPLDGATIPPGKILFRWTGSSRPASYNLQITHRSDFSEVLQETVVTNRHAILEPPNRSDWLYWRVLTKNVFGKTVPLGPPARFRIDPSLPSVNQTVPPEPPLGPNGELIRASLRNSPFNVGQSTPDGLTLNGRNERLVFKIDNWPEESWSVSLRFRLNELPTNRLGQIFSAWAGPMDDPLRLTIDHGKLYARIEAGGGYSTPGVPVQPGIWYDLLAVREGPTLRFYLDAKETGRANIPEFTSTAARDFALGGNPHYSGNEYLAITVSDLAFYPRAVTPSELSR